MPMSSVTIQDIALTGVKPTYEAANVDGNYSLNPLGRVAIHIKNAAVASITVTLKSERADNYGNTHDEIYTCPASSEMVIGFCSPRRFDSVGSTISWTYSAITTVTVAALRVV